MIDCRARESVFHTLYEMDAWMEKYMGPDAVPKETVEVSEEVLSAAKL